MRLLFAALLLLTASPVFAQAPTPNEDERLLASADVGTSASKLLEFLRRRATGKADRETLLKLVKQLSVETPAEVSKAMGELIAFGPAAVPVLREVQKETMDV